MASRQQDISGWIDVGRGFKRRYRDPSVLQWTLLSSLVTKWIIWKMKIKRKHPLEVRLCWPPSSWPWISKTRQSTITAFWDSVDEDYQLLYTGEVRLETSTNQTEYQSLSRRQQQSVQLANKTPCCGHRDMGARISKHATHNRQIEENPHNRSEIRRRAMIFHTLHFVITTYQRFFEAESAYFSVWKPNTKRCYTLATTTLPLRLAELLPGKLQVCGKRTAIIRNQFTPKDGKQNIQTAFGFRNKNANMLVTITSRARAILTNHGLWRCPWHVHAWRGGEGGTTRSKPVISSSETMG